MQYTRNLGSFLSKINLESLPKEVIEMVKLITLHTIAVSISGKEVETSRLANQLGRSDGGQEESVIWGSKGKKVPASQAVFVNGTDADVMDWEDCHWIGHPSAGAIPVAFATAEVAKASGKQYIESVVAAYEAYVRIGMSIQPDVETQKLGGTGKVRAWGLVNWHIFSASIAAAKIWGLDAEQMATVISRSAYLTPVGAGNMGNSDIYHFAHGLVNQLGMQLAKLTKDGARLEYYADALDGPNGFWRQEFGVVDWSWLENLGERYFIVDTLLKHWPVNVWIQGPLDALDNLRCKHKFSVEDIDFIRTSPPNNIFGLDVPRPYRFMQAQYNLPHCFAAYLDNPEPSHRWFSPESCEKDSHIHKLSKLIEVTGIEMHYAEAFELFKEGSFPEINVQVKLKDGTLLNETLRFPKGHPLNQFTLKEEQEFFCKLASPHIGKDNAEKFAKAIENLEKIEDMNILANMLIVK